MTEGNRRFDWRDAERTIHFGRGRLEEAVELLGGPGYTLLTTARGREAAPAVAEAAHRVVDVRPGRVDEIAGELLGETGDADRLVALGGGRIVDVTKALTAARRRERPGTRAMAIPTTLSGAEMTWVHRHAEGVPADTARVRPALVLCDPALAASQPEADLAASALNALGHAAEAPMTTMANPVSTLAALEAARLIGKAFERSGDPDREGLALAAMLAGYSIDSAWYGLHHVLSQTLVRLAEIPHGSANAIMLPHTLGALAWRFPDQCNELAEALGGDPSEQVSRICALTGATRLSALGVTEETLHRCADAAAERAELELTPPRAERGEIQALYEHAL
jgi:alcohol dehydrogenase class IV